MPKRLDKTLETEIESVKKTKQEITKTISKSNSKAKRASNSDQKDEIIKELQSQLFTLSAQVEEIERKYEATQTSFLTQLKLVYTNPFYRRVAKTMNLQVNSGSVFDYSREAIHPYTDSLFL
jgi:transposase